MRITLATQGGLAQFPGLAKPQTLDLGSLEPGECQRLRRLAEKVAGGHAVARGRAPGPPDARTHLLTIEGAGAPVHLRLAEPIADADAAELVRAVRAALTARLRAGG
jgi:hypothetical protein